MWNKPASNISTAQQRNSFFSSGFYGSGADDIEDPSSNFMPSTPGVLAPSERVGGVRPHQIDDSVIRLATALQSSLQFDALRLTMNYPDWSVFAAHLQPFTVESTQEVIQQGASECTVYLIESGILGVHHEDGRGKVQLATVGAGSVVGEGTFFSRAPRNATVQAMNRCMLWGLSPMRYAELAHRHPRIALKFVMALGNVVTRRMSNKPKRAAIT